MSERTDESRSTDVPEDLNDATCASFVPRSHALSLPMRIVGMLTIWGRARSRLNAAIDNPTNGRYQDRVVRTLNQLRPRLSNATNAKLVVYRDTALFLAWSAINAKEYNRARELLHELDQRFPDSLERMSLRAQCVASLSLETSKPQAGRAPDGRLRDILVLHLVCLLRDPLIVSYGKLLRQALDFAHCWMKAEELRQTAASLESLPLASRLSARAAIALWQCPRQFELRSDAMAWASRLSPDRLRFSPRMHVDAWLRRAEIAEWEGDPSAVEQCARALLSAATKYPSAMLACARAMLFLGNKGLPSDNTLAAMPASDESRMLRLLCDMRRHATLQSAGATITWLRSQAAQIRPLDLRLVLRMLEPIMASAALRNREDTEICERLSREFRIAASQFVPRMQFKNEYCAACGTGSEFPIQTDLGNHQWRYRSATLRCTACGAKLAPVSSRTTSALFPWTVLRQAEKAILIDADYKSALTLLQTEELVSNSESRRLVQIARLLDGSPAEPSPGDPSKDMADLCEAFLCVIVRPAVPIAVLQDLHRRLCDTATSAAANWSDAVAACRNVLELTLGFLAGKDVSNSVANLELVAGAPAWAQWLLQLLALMCCPQRKFAQSIAPTSWEHTSVLGTGALGERAAAAIAADAKMRTHFCEALRRQRTTPAKTAMEAFDRIGHEIASLPMLLASWWQPVVQYWRGVTRARAGNQEALGLLRGLLGGHFDVKARAQLAILSVQRADLDGADQWIAPIETTEPSVIYARALIATRRGDNAAAITFLDSLQTSQQTTDTNSPYLPAARRLIGAIAERQGDLLTAQREYRQAVEANPHEPIAAARLGRVILHQLWKTDGTGDVAALAEVPGLFKDAMEHPAAPISWCMPYIRLAHLWRLEGEDIDALIASLKCKQSKDPAANNAAWNQLSLRCLLTFGRAQEVLEVLDKRPEWDEPTFKACYLILEGWSLLVRLWRPYCPPAESQVKTEAQRVWIERNREPNHDDENWALALARLQAAAREACVDKLILRDIEELISRIKTSDELVRIPIVEQWQKALELAFRIATSSEPAAAADWVQLGDWTFGHIGRLWVANAGLGESQAVASMLSAPGKGYSNEQITVLRAAVDLLLGHDDSFVKDYETLEPQLSALPTDPIGMWLAAAGVWHKRRNWQRLLDSDLPESVADLSNPAVRLQIGLSYAHAATDAVQRNDTRQAQLRIRQALDNIQGLRQETVAQGIGV